MKATFAGYFLQGACKFGFYEHFKHNIAAKVAGLGISTENMKLPIWIVSSGAAEVIASVALCPLEATKIFMMVNAEDARKGMLHSMRLIMKNNGLAGLYNGLPLLILRQLPYTCVKLSGYELFSLLINKAIRKWEFDTHFNDEKANHRHHDVAKQTMAGVMAGSSISYTLVL